MGSDFFIFLFIQAKHLFIWTKQSESKDIYDDTNYAFYASFLRNMQHSYNKKAEMFSALMVIKNRFLKDHVKVVCVCILYI